MCEWVSNEMNRLSYHLPFLCSFLTLIDNYRQHKRHFCSIDFPLLSSIWVELFICTPMALTFPLTHLHYRAFDSFGAATR